MRISKKLGAGALAATSVALLSCQLLVGCGSSDDSSSSSAGSAGESGATSAAGKGGATSSAAGNGGATSTAGTAGEATSAGTGGDLTGGTGGETSGGGATEGGMSGGGTGGASGGAAGLSGGGTAGTGGHAGSGGAGGAAAGAGGAAAGAGGAAAGAGGAAAGAGGAAAGAGGAAGHAGTAGSGGAGGAAAGAGGASGGSGGATAGAGGSGGAAVCGDNIKEAGELCDPKFTVNDCGSDCKEITSATCIACENTTPTGGHAPNCPTTSCDNVSGNAAAGPAAGTAKSYLCNEVLDCVRKSNCAQGGVSLFNCYCGAADPTTCLTAPAGACVTQLQAGLETTDFNTVQQRLGDVTFGGGKAMDRINCDQQVCDNTADMNPSSPTDHSECF